MCVIGFTNGRKIQAVKAIHAVTGWGLKEAKDCVDSVSWGTPQIIPVRDDDDRAYLTENDILWEAA